MLTYGDGLADVDLDAWSTSTVRTASSRRSRPCARRRGSAASSFDGDRVADVHREAADRRRLDQRRLLRARARCARLHRRRRHRAGSASRSSDWRRTASSMAFRHDGVLAVDGHLRDKRQLESLWASGQRAVEDLDVSSFWRDRPTLVTGATGLARRLARAARLVEQGADVVCLVRDWVPRVRAGAPRAGSIACASSAAMCDDQALVERALGEYEVDTVFHLAAQTIVGIASRNPVSTFETNIRGTWALLEAVPAQPGRPAGHRRFVRQGLRRPRDAAVHRGHAASGAVSLRRQQVLRRSDRAVVRRHATACRSSITPLRRTCTAAAI